MHPDATSFQNFLSTQLEELRLRLVTEFERLHGDGSAAKQSGGFVTSQSGGFVTSQGQDGEASSVDGNGSVGTLNSTAKLEATAVVASSTSPDNSFLAAQRASWDGDHAPLKPVVEGDGWDVTSEDGSAETLNSAAKLEATAVVASSISPDNSSLAAQRASWDGDHAPLKPVLEGGGWGMTSENTTATRREKLSDSPSRSSPMSRSGTLFDVHCQSGHSGVQRRTFAGNGVILPGSISYRIWSTIISVVVLLSCFLTPLRFAFFEGMDSMRAAEMALDLIFGFDILLDFNVAVMTKHGWATDRRTIFREHAFTAGFAIDLTATVPWDNIWMSLHEDNEANREIAQALWMLRLLKANNLLILFRALQKNTHFNLLGVVVAKFVFFIIICTHTVGCIFYKLAQVNDFGEGTWVMRAHPDLPDETLYTRYMHVLFWAVGTFKAGPASAGLTPTSNSEMLLAVLAMILNICLHTYLISNMAALLTTADVRIYNMRRQLYQVRDFAARFKLPRELHLQLRKLIKFRFASNDEVDQSLLSGLPDLYRQRISHVLFEDLVKGVDIFRSCASIFLRELHSNLTATLHMPNSQLSTVDGAATSLHIVAEGEVELLDHSGNLVDCCGRGECFTAVSFLCKVAQPYSVRTRMACRVLSIGAAAWESACTAFPESLEQVRHNLIVHCAGKVAEFAPATAGATLYTELLEVVKAYMVHQEELAIAMMISAAARGDIPYLRRRLLASTPNFADYDSRTPLHLGAARGHLETCALLLDARAAPGPVDNFGVTPLFEACRGRHDPVASLLYRKGAKFDVETGLKARIWEAAVDVDQLWYLRSLVRYTIDPNARDYDARTPLHVANAAGNYAAVEILLNAPNIDLDPHDNFGRTPLMEAVRHGHEACARQLKARGAFHGFVTNRLRFATANQIPAGQELCQAAFANQWNYVHNLTTYCGLDVDAGDYDLRTGLMLASAEGNRDVAVWFVQNKADVQRKDRWGHTAITEAEDHGHRDLAKLLKLLGDETWPSRRKFWSPRLVSR